MSIARCLLRILLDLRTARRQRAEVEQANAQYDADVAAYATRLSEMSTPS